MLPSGKRVDVKLHREILGLGYGDKREGDHINHDTLDNTDDNLRIPPTKSHQNANQRIRSDNVSGYKGVSFEKRNQKWYARIQIYGKEKFLGYFDEAKEAGRAYEKYAKEFLGEYACIDRRMKNAA